MHLVENYMPANKTLLSAAKSKVAATQLAKALPLEDLTRAIKNLEAAAEKIKKSEACKARRRRSADLKKLKAMMAKMGLSAADVKKLIATPPKRKAAGKKKTQPQNRSTQRQKGGTQIPNKGRQANAQMDWPRSNATGI